MKLPREYRKTKYKQINGLRWKITESLNSKVFRPQSPKDYYVFRCYEKRVNGSWVFVTGGRTDY